MLYCTLMTEKHTARSYKHSQQKNAKSCEKHLTRYKVSVKIRSLAASQPRSLAASQPRSLAAEAFPCLNKFTIKHKQIYSHKKPQRSPSLELRSTSQRIIKDSITKTLLNLFASLAYSAVKLKINFDRRIV
ncbi:hypothetical protein TDE_0976 [Treponema denticola ATCC 35405]|uniref:Uncharacterized protein n=1 Tax=Treponema denticola (strain ATCC 35405 / DSM 14222 / CIP 103919 / JCM 8153 / KCTC 15104) TaxID=243275 RepID=Q73P23_TREDE|nr:hypothetical protein TDE_0976 [Treponema denticola ATCC 35405]